MVIQLPNELVQVILLGMDCFCGSIVIEDEVIVVLYLPLQFTQIDYHGAITAPHSGHFHPY